MHYIPRKCYEYNEIINMLWDPDCSIFLNTAFVKSIRKQNDISHDFRDINDHNYSNKKYKNKIVKNANLFKTYIDSEDIRKGKLKKRFLT
ncbi:hypothetical protein PBNK65E_000258500 [Plasmodium berghei]|uniref:Uncharacterized protein n=1 Tax=Plasmodium berghei TaxID=5821 RepID=A0A1C6YJ23_PLABE|nr:hypothetical protein PBNK65NY_000257800 [Plasmodium berghei]SCN26569.1 hypothetical protein PBNK65E_000258500 [Plasmodium berghei]SCO60832.1 hypothetical protein PBSP11RLL_000257800 [Plasmodium berghei]SCO62806.1 hypothetical protein PBSP11A_000257800 [Plasmodium berghei]